MFCIEKIEKKHFVVRQPSYICCRYLLARRHLAMEVEREEQDEVSNKRLTSMAHDIANGLAFLHQRK